MSGSFRDLIAYRKATELADALRLSVRTWNSFDRWTIGAQLVRSADSIGANIAEGWARGRYPDRRRLLLIARGSAIELQHWLERAEIADLALPEEALERAIEVGKMINGLARAWGEVPSTRH